MLKRELLLAGCAIALMLSGQEANAAEACTKVPTCAELGYTQTTCGELLSLKCPFDQTKLFCGSTYKPCDTGYVRINGVCIPSSAKVVYSGNTAIGVEISSGVAIAMTPEGEPGDNPNSYHLTPIPTWAEANAKCQSKTDGGKKWRLPTKAELLALNDAANIDNYKKISATIVSNRGIPLTGMPSWVADHGAVVSAGSSAHFVSATSGTNFYVRCVFNF